MVDSAQKFSKTKPADEMPNGARDLELALGQTDFSGILLSVVLFAFQHHTVHIHNSVHD